MGKYGRRLGFVAMVMTLCGVNVPAAEASSCTIRLHYASAIDVASTLNALTESSMRACSWQRGCVLLRPGKWPDPFEANCRFLAGTRTRLTDGASAAEILRQGDCRLAVIESRHDRAFAQRAERIGLRYSLRARLDNSININGGRAISFAIYRSEPQQ